jgi:hypothetical protein
MSDALIVLLIIFVMLYLAFLFWYGGRSKPLTQAEVESLLAEIKRRGGKQSQEGEPLLFQQFRDLAKSDDGREPASRRFQPTLQIGLACCKRIRLWGYPSWPYSTC